MGLLTVAHGSRASGGWSAIGCYCRGSAPTAWGLGLRNSVKTTLFKFFFFSFFLLLLLYIFFLFVGTQKWVTTDTISYLNPICIVTMVAKYHSHTNLVIDITITKHHSRNLGHPHRSVKYHYNISLATDTMVTNYLSFLP